MKKLLFLISFVSLILPSELYSQGKSIDQIIAVVGDNFILKSDIENQYLQMNTEANSQIVDLKCAILEEHLYQSLLLHQASIDSITVTDKEIDSQLERRLRYFVSQIGSEKKLEEYFKKSMPEIKSDLRSALKKQMIAERMNDKIVGNVKVTPTEVRQIFKTIPEDSIPNINEQLEYEQIVIYPVITNASKLAVKEKLNGLRERILKGEKFSTLAALYSEDPGSAAKGGELGLLGRTDLVPEFSAVAFKLKDGEVSKIVETEFGYHIIQLIERRGEQINVRHILISAKPDPTSAVKARMRLDSIARIIKLDSISFSKAAEVYSQDVDSRMNGGLVVNPYTNNSFFEYSQLDATTSYWVKKLKPGQISEPFEYVNEKSKKSYKIIRLKDRRPSHKANLKDDYQTIQDYAISLKKQDILKAWIQKEQKLTYIRIDNSFKNCDFKYKGWIK